MSDQAKEIDKGLEFTEWAKEGVECHTTPTCESCARMLAIFAAVQAPTSDDLYEAAMSPGVELSSALYNKIAEEMELHLEAAIALASWVFHRPGTRLSDKDAITRMLAVCIEDVARRNNLNIIQVPMTVVAPQSAPEGKTH